MFSDPGEAAILGAIAGQVSNLKSEMTQVGTQYDRDKKTELIKDANFDLSKLAFNNDGYLYLASNLSVTYFNWVWLKGSEKTDTISVNAKFPDQNTSARICYKDVNGKIIYINTQLTSSKYVVHVYDSANTLIGTLSTGITYDSSSQVHNIKVVKIGYTIFYYFDNAYYGKVDAVNYIGLELAAIGFGFRGNTSNNSYYATPELSKVESFAHFSFDDQISVLKDLTTNASTYTSIFDNSDLAGLKELHDTYGCVFTLMLFYQDAETSPTFTLASMTNKFKNEFTQNSGWLKFGYHGPDPNTKPADDMTTAELITSVGNVYTAIGSFAGKCCIDYVPRISYFNCTKEQANGLKSGGYIQGLLTADDNRTANCGLTDSERAVVQNYDVYTDYDNAISYFRSELRIDDTSEENLIVAYNNLFNSVNNHKQFVIFGHGYTGTLLTKLQSIVEWCFKHNMTFDYPVNHLGY